MSSLNNNCFFCGKDVLQMVSKKETDSTTESVGSLENADSSICRETVNKSVAQISYYLQITKSEFINIFNDGIQKIKICPACWNISARLGKLCGELEVIQMKIKYFLNLLTDQILTNDQSQCQTSTEAPVQVHESNFQELFHQKCLSKLASFQNDPELRITKCKPPKRPKKEDTFFGSDDFGDDDVSFGEDLYSNSVLNEDSSKSVTGLETISHFKCTHCPMTLSNSWNLEKHVIAAHGNKKNRHGHRLKTCEHCGAMISSNNLIFHIKNKHGIGRTLPANLEIIKMKRCETCQKLISTKNASRHKKLCGRKGKKVKTNLGQVSTEMYLVKKNFECAKCKKWFGRKGSLIRHLGQNEVCRRDEKNIMETKAERRIRCTNNCGESFRSESNMRKHLKLTCKVNCRKEDSNRIEIRVICDSKMGENTEMINIKEEIPDI